MQESFVGSTGVPKGGALLQDMHQVAPELELEGGMLLIIIECPLQPRLPSTSKGTRTLTGSQVITRTRICSLGRLDQRCRAERRDKLILSGPVEPDIEAPWLRFLSCAYLDTPRW